MKDIKDFIKVADLYAQDSLTENKKIEGFEVAYFFRF